MEHDAELGQRRPYLTSVVGPGGREHVPVPGLVDPERAGRPLGDLAVGSDVGPLAASRASSGSCAACSAAVVPYSEAK